MQERVLQKAPTERSELTEARSGMPCDPASRTLVFQPANNYNKRESSAIAPQLGHLAKSVAKAAVGGNTRWSSGRGGNERGGGAGAARGSAAG